MRQASLNVDFVRGIKTEPGLLTLSLYMIQILVAEFL
jgi:hypothetical protein